MEGLPRETRGAYRGPGEEVVAGIFTGPSSLLVPTLMQELIDWLRCPNRIPPLVRSVLLHRNVIAIHPFNDGNGRAARILSAMELIRDGVRSPELISIEAYLRRHRDEYIAALRTTLGASYDPDNHPVTEWLDYYTRVSLDRLEARNRILDALPADIGVLHAALADTGEPVEWAVTLLAARVGRLRTAALADLTGRSASAARAELGRMTRAGWLHLRGVTRGQWYAPTERLATLRSTFRSSWISLPSAHSLPCLTTSCRRDLRRLLSGLFPLLAASNRDADHPLLDHRGPETRVRARSGPPIQRPPPRGAQVLARDVQQLR